MAAAPTMAATPMLATLALPAPVEAADGDGVDDADVEVAGLVEVVDSAVVVGFVVGAGAAVVAGVVAAGVEAEEAGELAPAGALEAPPAGVDPAPEPEPWLDPPIQLVLEPELMEKAADCAVAPVLSRRVKPMEVPAAISVVHVNDVPFCWPRSSRAAALGWLPGRMLKK